MNYYQANSVNPNHTVTVWWNGTLNSYCYSIMGTYPSRTVKNSPMSPGAIPSVEILSKLLRPFAIIPDDVDQSLRQDGGP